MKLSGKNIIVICICPFTLVWYRQIALADLVMVNKVDLVSKEELRAVSERVR